MQKVINAMAVLSFIGTASIIGGGVYVYTQRDALVEQAKERIAEELAKVIPDMITGALGGSMMGGDLAPELPAVPGGSDSPVPGLPAPTLPF